MNDRVRMLVVVGVVLGVAVHPRAQTPDETSLVDVDGRAMRVAVAGLGHRAPDQPVIVLEAGAGESGLDAWAPVFRDLARLAPVVAYDRRGIGQSEPDVAPLTLRRGAQSLRRLLDVLRIAPPYVLVGHSWGGLQIRAFVDLYPRDVVGLVFLDALNPGPTRAARAAAVPAGDRAAVLAPPVLPPIPPDTPAGLRAEYALIGSEMVNDYPEARSLRAPADVPVVVVLAVPPGRLPSLGETLSLDHDSLAGLALRSPKGLFLAAGHVGHAVQRHDPGLVVQLVEHVLKHRPAQQP